MPRLIEYISIGICSGYGDGDFRVSMDVCKLSRKSFDEVRLATLNALRVAEDSWCAAQAKLGGQAAAMAEKATPTEDHP
jgi:hypothetical protein